MGCSAFSARRRCAASRAPCLRRGCSPRSRRGRWPPLQIFWLSRSTTSLLQRLRSFNDFPPSTTWLLQPAIDEDGSNDDGADDDLLQKRGHAEEVQSVS